MLMEFEMMLKSRAGGCSESARPHGSRSPAQPILLYFMKMQCVGSLQNCNMVNIFPNNVNISNFDHIINILFCDRI